ncbi:HAD family hydrolase [Kineosporia succinea]|uniref:Hydrolase of the HAD superfamily n=1 Tax=Kineosporia succinea TaxID=84632 RepID=A0ABT9NW84_9ACTN|nr:HAD family hydrolase [Kineosporia succinea]MDP9824682.1 putative hydrolase of the HAD superfamily [Kineosporia succinea]
MPIEAVIFDWGGTLTPWHPIDLVKQWQVFAQVYSGDDPDAGAELAARMFEAERAAWGRLKETGASARLSELFEAVGVHSDHPGHDAARVAYEEFWEPHTCLDPDVPVVFEGLRERGIRVGVLSNTIWTRDYHRGLFERDGILHLIDGDVYSSEIPWVKPHPEAFGAALSAVGATDPSACVYVGDRVYEDVHGSQRVGMRAVHVPHSDIPLDQQVPVEVTPDGTAHRLLDVLDLVDGWA